MKIFKYLIGALLIPVAIAFSKYFYIELSRLDYLGARMHIFSWGIIVYMLVHILLYKPVYLYTLGHESIHALATWICGGHITSFHVSSQGGSVGTSKSNFFIELSPYFVPVYTILLIVLTPLMRNILANVYTLSLYMFLLGFTLGMHLIMTAEALKLRQTDILKSGYAFSFMLIYIGNLLIVFLILSLFNSGLSFKTYFMKSLIYSRNMYLAVWNKFF
ncbi:MAG: hypothetical protein HQ579_02895 [Candidatus Omnitrophica bacterium]|nr:hypothetical protein [Candidatus Omnitrophota bacterium]